jgi:hypothetical protein
VRRRVRLTYFHTKVQCTVVIRNVAMLN